MTEEEQLVLALRPLLRPKARFTWQLEEDLPLLASRYGGLPYLERETTWPRCETCGVDMAFVCQLNQLEAGLPHPPEQDLVAIFCCRNPACREPFRLSHPDNLALRFHWAPEVRSMVWKHPSHPTPQPRPPSARITFELGLSLPDEQSLPQEWPDVARLLDLRSLADGQRYRRAAEGLAGKMVFRDYLGGYPHWDNCTDMTPTCGPCGRRRLPHLAQFFHFNRPPDGLPSYEQVSLFACPLHPEEYYAVFDHT